MEFFNKLTDVVSFTLTQHGRKLLASGSFNPVYYSFGDSNIIYDPNSFGITGSQNQTADQVDSLLIPKLNTYLSTIDYNQLEKWGQRALTPSILGSAELGQQNYPAFQIKLHSGRLSGSASVVTSTYLNQSVPTISTELICNFDTSSHEFKDHEYLLLEINEINGLFEKENFNIEFFKRKRGQPLRIYNNVVQYIDTPLFINDFSNTEDTFNGNSDFALGEGISIDITDINYWFSIETDEGITDNIEFDNSNIQNIYLRPENNIPPDAC